MKNLNYAPNAAPPAVRADPRSLILVTRSPRARTTVKPSRIALITKRTTSGPSASRRAETPSNSELPATASPLLP